VSGLEYLDEIEKVEKDGSDKPLKPIVIVDCGEIKS
jgi:hypothetical protein